MGGRPLVALPIGGGARGGHPYRSTPWVNFAAQWNDQLFAAGGEVVGEGSEAARHVRMRFVDGTQVEDDVSDGIVLFFMPHGVIFPATVDIFDANRALLSSHSHFEQFV